MKRKHAEALLARYRERYALLLKQRKLLLKLESENTQRDDVLPIIKMNLNGNHIMLRDNWSERQFLKEEIRSLEKLLTKS